MIPPFLLNIRSQGEQEILITRRFQAPRRMVFTALTTPELVKRWLGVRGGWILAECEIDLRAGGRYHYLWLHERSGKRMGAGGRYLEIVSPERIVSTETFDDPWYEGESILTVVLTEEDEVTLLSMTLRYGSKATRDGVLRSPMESGLGESYNMLETLLTEQLQTGKESLQ
ncbi:MAG: SRPBCC family protein [Acidobacteria bacterium]|nr:SRPBCC family protein [Acidobacteriota bacterium]